MPDFTYVARNSSGALTKGTINANDRGAAIRQI